MAGIKETKELMAFVINLAEAIDTSLEDGDIGFTDLSNLVSAMIAAGDAFSDVTLVPAELKDLDAAEAAELCAYAKDELNLNNADLEKAVEAALEIGLKIYDLYLMIKPAPAAPAA